MGKLKHALPSVPLLHPGVAAHMVPVGFPEAGPVLLYQFHPGHPLGALPCIQARYYETRRTAMLRRNRLTVVEYCHKRVFRQEVIERQIGRPTLVISVNDYV